MKLPPVLRAFAHRNFRLFFAGQSISLIGTWMQQVAMAWVVYLMTGSAWWLGLAGFAGQLPMFFLTPVTGVLVDRWNRHRLVLLTQTLAMLQAFLIAYLALAELIALWHILALSVFLGIVNAFDMPARQAFLVELVAGQENLANAIALNSSMVNAARLVGPALAGLLLSQTSAGVCFLVNALSFLAVLAGLLAMRVPRSARQRHRVPLSAGLREGLVYAFGFAPIRAILLLVALVSLVGLSYTVLLPVFAIEVLGGGPDTLGFLSAAAGVGALASALVLAARRSVVGLGRWIALAPGGFGLGLIALSFSRSLWLSLLLLVFNGFAVMMHLAASNTVVQTIVEEDKRGRVMSLYILAFMGVSPFGSLLAGYGAEVLGAPGMVRIAGVCCITGSVLFTLALPALRERVRPIYVEKGILPEIAQGLQAGSQLNTPPERQ
jgi:MFS family permease